MNAFAADLVTDVILANITFLNDYWSRFGSWVVPISRWRFCNISAVPVVKWTGRKVDRLYQTIGLYLRSAHSWRECYDILPGLIPFRGGQRGK